MACKLYGPDDHVVPGDFVERAAVAFPECVGPFVVPNTGHFLQWERAEVFNQAVKYFASVDGAEPTAAR